jgi:thymidylate kinase
LIAIIGVDGSGKTSTLEAVYQKLLAEGYDVQSLKIKTKKSQAGRISNHAFPARSCTVSIIKILWRGLVWTWKYYIRYHPLLRRGQIILSDRFYFDEIFLNPEKYRYGGPLWLARLVRNLLPNPNMYILLDAPEEVLFARKQETTFEEVKILRKAFKAWAESQESSYCVDASEPLEMVVTNTYETIINYLEDRDYPRKLKK